MRKIWNKGHRIRASDKHLVYHFSIGTLLFVFVAVLLLLNMKQLMRTDWEHFSLLENGLTLSPYNFITILIATGVCALVAFLYYRFCYDSFKKLLHRQKLARMVLENKWYEADTVQDSGFFTDLQSRSREKIVWFPKIYYQMEKGLLHIRCEITLGKYQDHTDPCRCNRERLFFYGLLCWFPASHYLSGGNVCCLYGTDKTGNQQGTSRCYQLCGGVRAVRFVYCLRSRLHQEDK